MPALLEATTNLLYTHASYPEDIRSSAALRSTSTGILSDTHGLLHSDRAMLTLILCEKWGGNVLPIDTTFFESLQALVGQRNAWWAKYTERVANGIMHFYSAWTVSHEDDRSREIQASSSLADGAVEETPGLVHVRIVVLTSDLYPTIHGWAGKLRKVGGKIHWVGIKGGGGWTSRWMWMSGRVIVVKLHSFAVFVIRCLLDPPRCLLHIWNASYSSALMYYSTFFSLFNV